MSSTLSRSVLTFVITSAALLAAGGASGQVAGGGALSPSDFTISFEAYDGSRWVKMTSVQQTETLASLWLAALTLAFSPAQARRHLTRARLVDQGLLVAVRAKSMDLSSPRVPTCPSLTVYTGTLAKGSRHEVLRPPVS